MGRVVGEKGLHFGDGGWVGSLINGISGWEKTILPLSLINLTSVYGPPRNEGPATPNVCHLRSNGAISLVKGLPSGVYAKSVCMPEIGDKAFMLISFGSEESVCRGNAKNTSKERSDLEGKLLSIRNLLSTQATLIHGLAEGVNVESLSIAVPGGSYLNGLSADLDRYPSEL
ncbi:exocyst complex component EXO84B [Tanacetum coccineum]